MPPGPVEEVKKELTKSSSELQAFKEPVWTSLEVEKSLPPIS